MAKGRRRPFFKDISHINTIKLTTYFWIIINTFPFFGTPTFNAFLIFFLNFFDLKKLDFWKNPLKYFKQPLTKQLFCKITKSPQLLKKTTKNHFMYYHIMYYDMYYYDVLWYCYVLWYYYVLLYIIMYWDILLLCIIIYCYVLCSTISHLIFFIFFIWCIQFFF